MIESFYVCEMNDGGWFIVGGQIKPDGQQLICEAELGEIPVRIAANSYRCVYGPASWDDAMEYMQDMEHEE
jgi:hypothetical protein